MPFANVLWESLKAELPLIFPAVLLVVAATVMLWPADLFVPKGEKRRWAGATAMILLVVLGLVLFHDPGRVVGFSGMFALDGVTRGFQVLCVVATLVTVLLSQAPLNVLREQTAEYYALLLYSLAGMLLLVGATDLVSLYFSLELMALCIYILVGYLRDQERSIEAGVKYFLLGAFSSGILLYGMSLLYAAAGGTTTNVAELGPKLALATANHQGLVFGGVLMVLVGFCFKVAAVPFHQWSPDAYEGAPTPITAFMSIAPKAAALAAFLRVFGSAFHGIHDQWSAPLAFVAAATMVWGNVAALRQQSMKRLLAYSSIAHVGYMLLGVLATDATAGAQAVWLYMLTYLLMQCGAFAIVIHLQGKGTGERIDDFRGLGRKHPALAFAMLVILLSLAGIPPMVGFFSKFYLFMLAIKEGYTALTTLAVLASAVSATYYLGVVQVMYFREPAEGERKPLASATALVATAACALILVGTAFGPWLLTWAGKLAWS